MGINITLAVSLNIINGHAGQFSLGHAGFMAVGAYFSAYPDLLPLRSAARRMPGGHAAVAFMQNVLFLVARARRRTRSRRSPATSSGIPSLRLRGDYLAIVTLGFGEIIRVLILNIDKIGAARGFSGIPHWSELLLGLSSSAD